MEDDNKIFACPFFIKSPDKFLECRKFKLSRIRDVKQHIWRRHQRPLYCPRCYDEFPSELARDEHVRAPQQCEHRPAPLIEGVTDEQQKLLRKRSDSQQTNAEQ